MKIVNWFLIGVFVLSAALQYNDPDPYIWVPIYLYAAFLCYKSIKGIMVNWMYLAGLAVYFGYALFLVFDANGVLSWLHEHQAENIVQSMKATKPWIEETREFGGLIICIGALLYNMVYWRFKRNAKA